MFIFCVIVYLYIGKNTGGKNQLYEKASQDDGPSADNNHQVDLFHFSSTQKNLSLKEPDVTVSYSEEVMTGFISRRTH